MLQMQGTQHHIVITKVFNNARQEEWCLQVLRNTQQLAGVVVLL